VAEEQRNYGVEPEPETSRPEDQGSDPSRLRRTHTAPATTTMSPKDEKTWSVLSHLTVFL